MSKNHLDCSFEVCEVRHLYHDPRAWVPAQVGEGDWRIELDDDDLDELRQLARHIRANPVQNLQRGVAGLELPRLRACYASLKAKLDHGVGFGVLDRLPLHEFELEVWVEVYWLLGQLIGRPVAQKWNGQMIYDVRDTGQAYSYGIRGSHTTVELGFHTDNAFARRVPDYVGLLCRNPAKSGGVSRFCSLYTVHQRLQREGPGLLARLYQPMLFDRQKEHAPGAAPVCLAPYFSWRNERLFARANSSLVRKGYTVAGEAMDSALCEALDALDEICAADDLWYEAELERGQIQYLNNHEVGHYRSAFEDFNDDEKKRHLFRLWHRDEGGVSYDGEALI